MSRFFGSLGAGLGIWKATNRLPRVALVEDNADSRSILVRMLSPVYQMDVYSSGAEALAGLEASPPDAVLLDICLPDMDGLEVLVQLRRMEGFKSIPFVAVTAYAMVGDKEMFLRMGFDDYTSKPIWDTNVLFNILERLINQKRSQS